MSTSNNAQKTKDLKTLLETGYKQFQKEVNAILENLYQKEPQEGSWSCAQIVDHVIKSNHFILETIRSESVSTGRPLDQYNAILKKIMDDMNVKGQASPHLQPGIQLLSRQAQVEALLEIKGTLLSEIDHRDLSQICTSFQFPSLGYLSCYELISFSVFHMSRHSRQIKKVFQQLQINNDS